jgi:hypothetical protein
MVKIIDLEKKNSRIIYINLIKFLTNIKNKRFKFESLITLFLMNSKLIVSFVLTALLCIIIFFC